MTSGALPAPSTNPSTVVRPRARRVGVGSIVTNAVLVLLALAVVLPVIYAVITALGRVPYSGYGANAAGAFGALGAAWNYGLMPQSAINSLIYSTSATIILWVVCMPAAYTLVLLNVPHRDLLLMLVLSALMIPIQVVMFPLFLDLLHVGLLDSYLGLVLGFVAFGVPLTTFQFAAYFKTLPRETVEAARVDGASAIQTLVHVVVPMSMPVVAMTGTINFVWTWNDILLPFIVIQSSDKKPLIAQLAVTTQSQYFSASVPVLAAAAVIGMAPTVVIYLVLQRQIVTGLAAGAVK
jgi:ABC-type glycerol-3-phosphate transport system permease component